MFNKKDKRIELINQLFHITSSTLNLQQLLSLIMEITLNFLKADVGNIALWDRKTNTFYSNIVFGLSFDILNKLKYKNQNLLDFTVKNKGPVIISDYDKHNDVKKPINIKSILCSPLRAHEKIIGAIFLINKTWNNEISNFNEEDISILNLITPNIAFAIEKAQLYHEVLTIKNYNDSIMNSISIGVITTDLKGNIISTNNSARFIFNLSNHESFHNIQEVLEKLNNEESLLESIKSKENILNVESIFTSEDNTEKVLNTSISVLNDINKEIIGYVITFDDVTEKKAMEMQMLRSEQLVALGELSASIAHEIKNPLTSIKGFSEILPKRLEDKEFLLKYSQIIQTETERLNSIIENMLQFTRTKNTEMNKQDLEKIINSVIELMNYEFKKNNITLEIALSPMPLIYADADLIKQVFLNLFLNAVQSMEKNGTIKIKNKIIIKKSPEKFFFEYNAISLSDTGKGISEKNISKLFHPFFSTKPKGTGLGLSISHKIITEHKGFIEVFSKEKVGTTFTVYLPTINN